MNATPALVSLAEAAGLLIRWEDVHGTPRIVEQDTLQSVLDALGWRAGTPAQCQQSLQHCLHERAAPWLRTVQLGEPLLLDVEGAGEWCDERGHTMPATRARPGVWVVPEQPGYWRLRVGQDEHAVAVAPTRCFSVADATGLAEPRSWGAVLQVYAARRAGDDGIGDSSAAQQWCERIAAAGGDAVALSPLHAAGRIDASFSPYSPSDRRFLEPVYAGTLEECDMAEDDAPDPTPADGLIDWAGAAAHKWHRLQQSYQRFTQAPEALQRDLRGFEQEGGAALAAFARCNAAAMGQRDPALQVHAQWRAARSWQQAQRRAQEAGMALGLIADLAVGFTADGAEAAAAADTALRGLVLGAPPDAFAPDGQVWGISSYSPDGLRRSGFAPFITLLRAVMRDRGGVRIDHILGLQRLWVVPRGAGSGQGVYLRYPLADLLNLLALESWRNRCIVIGEDLGVVPPGIRDTLAARGVLGMDVLAFTRAPDGDFLPPAQWRSDAVALTGTHDLPTLEGWQHGDDLRWRARLSAAPAADTAQAMAARREDVVRLARAVGTDGAAPDALRLAALRQVAASPAPLALLPVEDALGLRGQVNLPGTVAVHPNWRQRLPSPLPLRTLDRSLQQFAAARRGQEH